MYITKYEAAVLWYIKVIYEFETWKVLHCPGLEVAIIWDGENRGPQKSSSSPV